MSEELRKRLRELMAARKITAAALSRAIGRNDTFVRDFLNGKKDTMGAGDLLVIERMLLVPDGSLAALAAGEQPAPPLNSLRVAGRQNNLELGYSSTRRIPVYGRPSPRGLDGLIMTAQPVDFAPTPSNLIDVKDAFAIFVPSQEMENRYLLGEVVYVNPTRPVTEGAFALVRFKKENRAVIRRILRLSPEAVEVEQYNPPKRETIPRADIEALQRIVGAGEH